MAAVTRPVWHVWAACRGRVALFYDTSPRSMAAAKAVCASCGVRKACLREALELEADESRRYGVRGGLTPAERDIVDGAGRATA